MGVVFCLEKKKGGKPMPSDIHNYLNEDTAGCIR